MLVLLLVSSFLTLSLSQVTPQFYCVEGTSNQYNPFYEYDGTYMYWNDSYNGYNVWEQTNDEHSSIYRGTYAQCTEETQAEFIMQQLDATACWCINWRYDVTSCDYLAPVNDTSRLPDNTIWGWYNDDFGFHMKNMTVTQGVCADDTPPLSSTVYCLTGSEDGGVKIDGIYTKTTQIYNGESVWVHSEETEFGGTIFVNKYWLFLGANGEDCKDSDIMTANNAEYCWCIDGANPFTALDCDYFTPLSTIVNPEDAPNSWYYYTTDETTQLPDFNFEVATEECEDSGVKRMEYSFIFVFLSFLIVLM